MLLLDYQNVLIQSLLTERFSEYELPSPRTSPAHCIHIAPRHPANKLTPAHPPFPLTKWSPTLME
jgi:hypothetical protein